MSWGSSSKNGRQPTHARGQVVWTDRAGGKPAPFVQAIPKLTETRAITPEKEQQLDVGTMWQAKFAMVVELQSAEAKFPVLTQTYWEQDKAPVKQNSVLIYSGIVRVEERNSDGRIISVPRHTFIAGEGRYIITNFELVAPVL